MSAQLQSYRVSKSCHVAEHPPIVCAKPKPVCAKPKPVCVKPAPVVHCEPEPVEVDPCEDPCADNGHGYNKQYMWIYLIVAALVMLVFFWYGTSTEVKERLAALNVDGVEWVTSSTGKLVQSVFFAGAFILFAWACSKASSGYGMAGDMRMCWFAIGFFLVTSLVILAGFVLFFKGSYHSAYYAALLALLMGVVGTVGLFYWKHTGPAVAMAVFSLWALVTTYAAQKVCKQNESVSL